MSSLTCLSNVHLHVFNFLSAFSVKAIQRARKFNEEFHTSSTIKSAKEQTEDAQQELNLKTESLDELERLPLPHEPCTLQDIPLLHMTSLSNATTCTTSTLEVRETDLDIEVHERNGSDTLKEEMKESDNIETGESHLTRSRTDRCGSGVKVRVVKVLSQGSFFALGLVVLVAGGVASMYHPYVDPDEYENCTASTEQLNDSIANYC